MCGFPEKELNEQLKSFSFDDLDFDLMTFAELSILEWEGLKINKLIVRRAKELGFNLNSLTREQRMAALSCMTPEELSVADRLMEILLKNTRLKKNLSKKDKRRKCP